jgi:polycomb protein EED
VKLIEGQIEARNCCMTWTKDRLTGSPLLCVAGDNAKIKVIDARTGALRAVGQRAGFDEAGS